MKTPFRFWIFLSGILAAIWVAVPHSGWATQTHRFVDDSFADFQEGETTTSTLSDLGILTLPPGKEKVYSPSDTGVFWDGTVASKGRVFLGSGHSGKVFLLDENSSGSLYCTLPSPEVYSVAGFQTLPPVWQRYHNQVHTSAHQLARIVAAAQPGLTILYHQLFWGVTEDELLNEIRTNYDGPVVSGRDLDVYDPIRSGKARTVTS